jgi:hypothetical protein
MRKLLWLGAVVLVAGCSGSPTAPSQTKRAPTPAVKDGEPDCPYGFVIAYDEGGNAYCAPDGP